ncbi:MAG: permease [Candidatus Zixiibacteriota bacterium]
MSDYLTSWGMYTWDMLVDSAFLLFIGFFLAGIMRAFITPTAMQSLFGKSQFAQIFRASLIGIPLPLCSCSVLPVAVQLNSSGLSKPGTVSFLISTPETGADSIALSYKLLGPFYAVIRPIVALVIAVISGLMTKLFASKGTSTLLALNTATPRAIHMSLRQRLIDGQNYVVKDVIPELAYYLFWGYLLAGLAAALIPADLVQSGLPGWLQYLAVIIVSLPVYVCATSSTPLAAVLLSIGVLPGAVLVFLTVGPATNLTSLMVQKKLLGLRGMLVMTISVVISSIICGILIDTLMSDWAALPSSISAMSHLEQGSVIEILAALALALIMLYYSGKRLAKKAAKLFSK